jgi:hypothetical protein
MGKLTSIYLTPEEDEALRAYCNKHGCTPHSVIKAGLHWMLEEIQKNETAGPAEGKKVQEAKPVEARKKQYLAALLKALRESEKKE